MKPTTQCANGNWGVKTIIHVCNRVTILFTIIIVTIREITREREREREKQN